MTEPDPGAIPAGGPIPGPVRVRFAPSPTGTLHVGSARTALYNYLFARHQKGEGRFILRIEDTDIARSTREFENSIMEDLKWLGLEWDEGPDLDPNNPDYKQYGPYRQSERSAAGLYQHQAERLLNEGKAYYCFCPQERLEQLKAECRQRGEMPKYDRRCALLELEEASARVEAGEAAAIRFLVPETEIEVADIIHGRTEFSSDVIGDFIILRSDGGASYNFAVVVDDIAMGITHVIRGEDHLTNAARQVLIFRALGHEPPAWAHHSLIMGPDGAKLSKRHGATSVGDFREMGYLSSAIINYLALLSWSPGREREKLSKAEMVDEFELQRVSKSPAIFDLQKLNWLNGKYIRDLSHKALHAELQPFLGQIDLEINAEQLAVAESALQTSMVTLADSSVLLPDFFSLVPLEDSEAANEILNDQSRAVIDLVNERFNEIYDFGSDFLVPVDAKDRIAKAYDLIQEIKKECKNDGIPAKIFYRTVRIALTGKTSGPELQFLLAGLGRETIGSRLAAAEIFSS